MCDHNMASVHHAEMVRAKLNLFDLFHPQVALLA